MCRLVAPDDHEAPWSGSRGIARTYSSQCESTFAVRMRLERNLTVVTPPLRIESRRNLVGIFDDLSDDNGNDNDASSRKRKRSPVKVSKMDVVLRIRPTPDDAMPECIHATGANSIAISAPEGHMGTKNAERSHIFAFSKVLQHETSNRQLFTNHFAQKVLSCLLPSKESLVVFAYGITATGKTHSMEGRSEDPGIIPQALQLLFQHKSNDEQIYMSMYEIYNENIHDMFISNPLEAQATLKLKEDRAGNIWIPGLSQKEVTTPEDARALWQSGQRLRKHAATGMNKRSSRSHSVVMINVHDGRSNEWMSSVSFVDLAGSERQLRTGNSGLRLKESVAINSSLMTLGRCLEALRWNHDHKTKRKRHIPFRQAKITHAFKNAFLGSGSTVLLVNVSASAKDYEETVHVLKYASLATTLPCASNKARAIMNVEPAVKRLREVREKADSPISKQPVGLDDDDDEHDDDEIESYQHEIEQLRADLFESERRAAEMEARIREEVAGEMSELLREMESSYHQRLETEVSAAKSAAAERRAGEREGGDVQRVREMEELQDTLCQMESDLEAAKHQIDTIKKKAKANEESLLRRFQSDMEEERTQMRANATMEKETLEMQLERQRQENETMRERLKTMKEAMAATLRRYKVHMSPATLSFCKMAESGGNGEDEGEGAMAPNDDITLQMELKTAKEVCEVEVPKSRSVPRKKKSKKRRAKKQALLQGEQGGDENAAPPSDAAGRVEKNPIFTPLAKRTRAGRRACGVAN